MGRHIDILEQYYEQIRENIKLDINPSVFAAKCVREYQEKMRHEREHERKIKRELAFEAVKKEKIKKGELKKLERERKPRSANEELRRLGRVSSLEYLRTEGESKMKSLKDLAKLVDIIRGE